MLRRLVASGDALDGVMKSVSGLADEISAEVEAAFTTDEQARFGQRWQVVVRGDYRLFLTRQPADGFMLSPTCSLCVWLVRLLDLQDVCSWEDLDRGGQGVRAQFTFSLSIVGGVAMWRGYGNEKTSGELAAWLLDLLDFWNHRAATGGIR